MSSASAKSQIFSSTDVKFFLTFIAGMGAFWLSGQLPRYIPLAHMIHNRPALAVITLVLALIVYGLVMFLWALLIQGRTRSLRGALFGAGAATILALATSLLLTYTKIGTARTRTSFIMLIFGIYLAYGIYFVIGWLVSKQLAKKRG